MDGAHLNWRNPMHLYILAALLASLFVDQPELQGSLFTLYFVATWRANWLARNKLDFYTAHTWLKRPRGRQVPAPTSTPRSTS